jgi:hypothetical protein
MSQKLQMSGIEPGESREIICNQWQTTGMSKTPETPPSGKITISLHQLWVEVEHEASYPDQISDLSNRALELFKFALNHCKEVGIDIREVDPYVFEDEDDA